MTDQPNGSDSDAPAESIWRNGDYVRLWSAATVSIFGSLITRAALPFAAIIVLGAGPLEIAAIRSFEIIGGLVFGLVAGAWVDRLRRRPVMVIADVGRVLLLGSIPVAALAGGLSIGQLVAVAFLTAVLTTFFNVADVSYLPTLVARGQIIAANAALTASGSVAEFSAFGIGGVLVQVFSAPIAIAVDALSFLVSAMFIGSIRRPEPVRPAAMARDPILREIGDGLRVIIRSPVLRALAGASAAAHVLWGAFGAVYLVFAFRELGFGPAAIGLIAAVGGASSFVGALLSERIGRRLGIGPALIFGMVGFTVGNALIPIAPAGAIVVAVVLLVAQQLIADGTGTVYEVNELSLLQSVVPNQMLGRVNGSIEFFTHLWLLVGTVAGGLIGEAIGLRAALAFGLLGGLAGIAFLWFSPVRRMIVLPPRTAETLLPGDRLPITE